ncbi:prepilin-type N-terminal cleavage/methylation domain-containing protein [Bdellovibrio sp. HCB288]|uniref:prepilin-type N-terminal cleavage/methylation domain-containing protein n=1 Tax=Bdellovibrio sp. HCB288 TaxID=3394355 RepID=UPI0039B424D1
MKLNNNRGYSMIELLAAIVVGVIVSYATYAYITYISNLSAQMRLTRASNDNVQAIVESIRFNLSLYQVSFETNMTKEEALLKRDALPFGLSYGTMIPKAECFKENPCQAYFGYVIVPSLFVRNLYQVDLRVALPADKRVIGKQEERWKQYTYFITVK